jgi:luciferase family oxidoreductase group 1
VTRRQRERPMRISILDFQTPAFAVELAPAAERLGYHRYWLGEHHGQYQCANPLLMATVLAGLTERIRLGTGGICLTYSNAYRVAEDARLANYLFPDRLDLGVVRGLGYPAPLHEALAGGADGGAPAESFESRATELHQFVTGRVPGGHPLAGTALHLEAGPPVWILGTSIASARFAARMGAGFCISLHHSPEEAAARAATSAYEAAFSPSPEFPEPAAIAVVSGVCAEERSIATALGAETAARAAARGSGGGKLGFAGDPDDCAEALTGLARRLNVGELMILDFIAEGEQRVRMYELLAGALGLGEER